MAQALYGQPNAGDVFFDRLEETQRSRKDTQQLADVLEVYLLCMLLGFEGRYSGGSKAEIRRIVDQTRSRIDHIRQRSKRLSPDAALPDAATPMILPGPKNRFHHHHDTRTHCLVQRPRTDPFEGPSNRRLSRFFSCAMTKVRLAGQTLQ